ncbi:MAG: hypothetical protein EAZ49_01480 [Oscillatoriales cyanobacterium]|nr:MAG: hypothetical protein EAZ49_01480 [Oscillatoriales cyanobacterium]
MNNKFPFGTGKMPVPQRLDFIVVDFLWGGDASGCIWFFEEGSRMTAYKLLVIISYFMRSCFAPTDIFACIEMHPREPSPNINLGVFFFQ